MRRRERETADWLNLEISAEEKKYISVWNKSAAHSLINNESL